ncbi:MAG: ATP-binding cassette domain-containing protein [Gammaproteobacteria bacterium]|nr:ATP-binding cassette domain-containing protein [Gammaproteobacteria bacterium]MDH3372000.1 ATP-binding cassette domain-containing protein [Gammaproteobacteria bacterium]MDH3408536.1 ATP-binding cassette domain-containing protein [Gammaproteobacteria bacterium]MDH3552040.1 ATP-binding cassette domain-containing protein [Gammaproteobacteria bacterium]
MPDNLIEVRDVDFSRGDRPIFSNLNLTIERGDVTAIMGPSGTGKTTLLQLITRQLSPDRGQIIVDGVDIATLSQSELYELRKRFGVLFQHGALLTDMSVFENVAFPIREHTRLPNSLVRQVVLTKLHAVGLRGAADLMPAQLSGGMARRVALARAIAMDPDILLYDEPFVGLDPISMGVIVKLVGEISDALDITSIVVSHDVHDVSAVADYCYVIADGDVAAAGTPAELKAASSELVNQFMHGLPDGPVGFHYDAPDYHEQLLGKRSERA